LVKDNKLEYKITKCYNELLFPLTCPFEGGTTEKSPGNKPVIPTNEVRRYLLRNNFLPGGIIPDGGNEDVCLKGVLFALKTEPIKLSSRRRYG